MLSDCSSCKFFHPQLCAVNPLYRQRADRWRSRLSEQDLADLAFLGAQLQPCSDWEPSPQLEPVAMELTLTRRQWLQVGNALARAGLLAAISPQLEGVLSDQEVVMVAVVSTNITAIGYDGINQVLLVDFHTGSRYRYAQVPQGVFEAFLQADSKGQFLNYQVKGVFAYERVE